MPRPTALTPELHAQIVGYIAGGFYKETAAQLAGISERTLYRWIEKGEDTEPEIDPDDYTKPALKAIAASRGITYPANASKQAIAQAINEAPNPYRQFSQAVKEAMARGEAFALQQMFTVGKDDWRMWMTYLERTRPAKYARRERQAEEEETDTGSEYDAERALARGRDIKLKLLPGGKEATG